MIVCVFFVLRLFKGRLVVLGLLVLVFIGFIEVGMVVERDFDLLVVCLVCFLIVESFFFVRLVV